MKASFLMHRQGFRGERLREAREANGIHSRRDLARRLGVPRRTINLLETRPVSAIGENLLTQLVLALDVPAAWFFRRAGRSKERLTVDFFCHIEPDGTGYAIVPRPMHGLSYEELHRTPYGARTIGKVRR